MKKIIVKILNTKPIVYMAKSSDGWELSSIENAYHFDNKDDAIQVTCDFFEQNPRLEQQYQLMQHD